MRHVLHVVTRPEDPWARSLPGELPADTETTVRVVDLTLPDPDYRGLLEEIFRADSIVVW